MRWRFDAGGPVSSSPTLGDGTVYVGSRAGRLHAVGTADGRERWRRDDVPARGSPAVADGVLLVGDADGGVRLPGRPDPKR